MGAFHGFSLTSEAEEGLLALLRTRVEAVVTRQAGTAVTWVRPERSAERDDLRARARLDRAAADRLPSGRPWRGEVRSGRFFPRTRFGLSIGCIASWSGLSRGESGAATPAQAVAFFERERQAWRRRFGTKPFYAAVAGVFQDGPVKPAVENLALLSWENGGWRFRGRESQPELTDLFFPGPAEKIAPPARWQGMRNLCERLISPFRNRHRAAEASLAARTREFQEARREAVRFRDDCERHTAAGDWSEEMLRIQLVNGEHALRKASLLHRQVRALQENLQLLTTARLGGELIADSALPVDEEELTALERSYFQIQARRQEVVRAERSVTETLLADEAPFELAQKEVGLGQRLME